MPRPRKPEGERVKDKIEVLFVTVPREVYEQLEKLGNPHKVAAEILLKNLPK